MTRQEYLDKGVCPNCRCRNIDEPYKSCSVCTETSRKWMRNNRAKKDLYNKFRYETLKQLELCVQCKKPSRNTYCELCISARCRTRALNRPLHSRNRWSKR